MWVLFLFPLVGKAAVRRRHPLPPKPQPESEAGSLEAEGGDDQELQVASTAVPDTPLPQAPNEKEMVSWTCINFVVIFFFFFLFFFGVEVGWVGCLCEILYVPENYCPRFLHHDCRNPSLDFGRCPRRVWFMSWTKQAKQDIARLLLKNGPSTQIVCIFWGYDFIRFPELLVW